MRSLRLILIVGVVLFGATLTGHPASAEARKSCFSKRSGTTLLSATVRVFEKKHFVYACYKRRRRSMRLGRSSFGNPENLQGKVVLDLTVRSYFVAYKLATVPVGAHDPTGTTDLWWVDLRHRKRLNPPTGCTHRQEPTDGNGVVRIVLGSNGAMAWQCSDVVASEIHKVDSAGPNLLDTSLTKGPFGDMQLDLGEYLGVTVYWVNLDGLHMSRLVGPARLFPT